MTAGRFCVSFDLSCLLVTPRHFIALDEPTNYLDVETVDALGKVPRVERESSDSCVFQIWLVLFDMGRPS